MGIEQILQPMMELNDEFVIDTAYATALRMDEPPGAFQERQNALWAGAGVQQMYPEPVLKVYDMPSVGGQFHVHEDVFGRVEHGSLLPYDRSERVSYQPGIVAELQGYAQSIGIKPVIKGQETKTIYDNKFIDDWGREWKDPYDLP